MNFCLSFLECCGVLRSGKSLRKVFRASLELFYLGTSRNCVKNGKIWRKITKLYIKNQKPPKFLFSEDYITVIWNKSEINLGFWPLFTSPFSFRNHFSLKILNPNINSKWLNIPIAISTSLQILSINKPTSSSTIHPNSTYTVNSAHE